MRALRLDDTAYDEARRGLKKAEGQFRAMRKALEMSLEGDLVEAQDYDLIEPPDPEWPDDPEREKRAERWREQVRKNWR